MWHICKLNYREIWARIIDDLEWKTYHGYSITVFTHDFISLPLFHRLCYIWIQHYRPKINKLFQYLFKVCRNRHISCIETHTWSLRVNEKSFKSDNRFPGCVWIRSSSNSKNADGSGGYWEGPSDREKASIVRPKRQQPGPIWHNWCHARKFTWKWSKQYPGGSNVGRACRSYGWRNEDAQRSAFKTKRGASIRPPYVLQNCNSALSCGRWIEESQTTNWLAFPFLSFPFLPFSKVDACLWCTFIRSLEQNQWRICDFTLPQQWPLFVNIHYKIKKDGDL